MSEIKSALLIHFVEAIETTDFWAHSDIGRLFIKQSHKWITFSNTVSAKKVSEAMRDNASTCSKLLKLTMFASFVNLSVEGKHGTSLACTASIPRC